MTINPALQIDFKLGTYRAGNGHDANLMARAGWSWRAAESVWMTAHVARAAPLLEFCVGEAHKRVSTYVKAQRASVAASAAPAANVEIPIGDRARDEGKDYRPYQKAGIVYKRARKFALNGDVPRLGKTLQSIGVANTYPKGAIKRVLAIAPANAKIHWCREWDYWGAHGLEAGYCDGSENPKTPFLAINYDILSRHLPWIEQQEWDVIVFDECKNLRNPDSRRTRRCLGDLKAKQVTGGLRGTKHTMALDGTPFWKAPLDIWPIVRFGDRDRLGRNWYEFTLRYCNGHKDEDERYDCTGSSNEEELQIRLRQSIMVRREKHDVADELPPMRQTITLAPEGVARLVRKERDLVADRLGQLELQLAAVERPQDVDRIVNEFAAFDGRDVEHDWDDEFELIASVRRELAMAKVPHVVSFVKELLQNEPKVVIFAHHRSVVQALHEAFPGSARIWGGMSTRAREAERVRFQTDPECREIIGNITSMGSAIELSASDTVVFAELSWVPAELDQCEDRVWLPTKTLPIQIYRIVVRGTLEERMVRVLEMRQAAIERATVARTMKSLAVN